MSEPRPAEARAGTAPWIAASVLAAVVVALLVTLFVFLRPAAQRHDRNSAVTAFSAAESAAMKAAATETANLLTYSRKSFDADFARALAGTTGQLNHDLKADEATTKTTLTTNKFDIKAAVTDVALESNAGSKGMLVLVVANGYRIASTGTSSIALPQRVELTMVQVKGRWLVSDLQGLQAI
ncbi:MAG: hypothetical protein ACR2LF_05150 [Jatrophihabitantaceae bacterium]